MKRNLLIIQLLAVAALVASVLVAHALPLDESAWPEYQQHCPSPEDRVVFVEALEGRLAGYTNLVCLNERSQQTSKHLFDANFSEVSAADLPRYVRPALSTGIQQLLSNPASAINQNPAATVEVYLTIKTAEPVFPPLPYSYALSGSSYSDGSQVISTATYYVENSEVSQAEYEAYVSEARAAEDARRAEIQQSIEEQARLGFLELVDIAGLSMTLNVEQINNDASNRGYWWTSDTLSLSLTATEIKRLNQLGSERFYMEEQGFGVDDIVSEDGLASLSDDSADAVTSFMTDSESTTLLNVGVDSPFNLADPEASEVQQQLQDDLQPDNTDSQKLSAESDVTEDTSDSQNPFLPEDGDESELVATASNETSNEAANDTQSNDTQSSGGGSGAASPVLLLGGFLAAALRNRRRLAVR